MHHKRKWLAGGVLAAGFGMLCLMLGAGTAGTMAPPPSASAQLAWAPAAEYAGLAQPAPAQWRLVRPVPTSSYTLFDDVIAGNSRQVWAFSRKPHHPDLAWHRVGGRWVPVHLPLRPNEVFSGASAARDNVWAFASGFTGPFVTYTVALRLQGGVWRRAATLAGDMLLNSPVAAGPHDVWFFGVRGSSRAPVSWHFDGRRWHIAAASFGPRQFSALSARDIWAVGLIERQGPVAAHWDGRTWHITPLGRLFRSPCLVVNGVAALSSTNVWAVASTECFVSGANRLVGVLHFDGRTWRAHPVAGPLGDLSGIDTDGGGGLWIPITTLGRFPVERIVHYTRGTLAAVGLPHFPGLRLVIAGLAHIPGTTQTIAGADFIDSSIIRIAGILETDTAGSRMAA